ncbi:MAG: RNA polymerase subunit sigma-24 [Chloroflexi bacterium B3_Chlor]|nr:MAG: RNA polymerase subunit sigma-24 [Chloroflexi bacterium B3_Chlor]
MGNEVRTSRERTNQQWLDELRGPGRDEALADLRAILVRGLRYALASRSDVDEATLEDFAQEALLKIVAGLDSFRGESRFTTWAQKIAVRVALTELRRHHWRDISLDKITNSSDIHFIPRTLEDPSAGPEQQTMQHTLLETLRRLILEQLTNRQRQATTAVYLQGMPLEEVARRMGTNRNALYKLLHDARQRLQKGMVAEGLSRQDVLQAFGP